MSTSGDTMPGDSPETRNTRDHSVLNRRRTIAVTHIKTAGHLDQVSWLFVSVFDELTCQSSHPSYAGTPLEQ